LLVFFNVKKHWSILAFNISLSLLNVFDVDYNNDDCVDAAAADYDIDDKVDDDDDDDDDDGDDDDDDQTEEQL
jgi:hypothetical protein